MPRAKTMRRILLIVGIVLLAGAAAFTALLLFVDVNRFRGPIQAQLQRSLDRPVTLGPMGLKLLPLSIRVADLRIGESPAFRSPHPFVSAKEVHVRAGLLALMKGQVAVHSLHLVQPVVEIIRHENGAWNYSSLGGGRENESGRALTIDDLQIEDGSIAVTDLAARKPRVVYQHIDLRLRDFAPGRRLNLDVTARLPGSGEQTIALQARGTGLNDLEGRLSFNQVALSGLQPFFGSEASALDAILSGETDLRTEKDVLLGSGKLSMDQARLRGSELGFDIHADYQLSYDNSRELLEIRSLNTQLGGTAVSASGQLNLKSTPSQANLKAEIKDASITELARLAGVSGDVKGTASAEARAQGPLDRPEAWVWTGSGSIQNGSFSSPDFAKPVGIRSAKIDFLRKESGVNVQFQADVDEVSLASSGAPSLAGGGTSKPGGLEDVSGNGKLTVGTIRYGNLVLTQVQAECAIEGGIIRLAPITARLYGGQQSGSIIVDIRRAYPSFAVTTKLDKVDANQFLSATTSLKQTLYGLLATNADVQFAAQPGEDLARSLNGSVNLKLHQGRLAGINLMNEVASVAKFLGFRKSGEVATSIVDLTGDLKITDGTVRTDNVKMTLEDGSAQAAGMMNLADQTLDMRLLMTLHKDLSAQVGGSSIGGFMSTALGNEKGELMIPVVVSGTFAKPRVRPDAERIAQMKLKSLVPGASVAPGNVREKVEGLVDLLRRRKKQ
ncbi:MAG: AsmA family protein [Bryobacteraceae bacterium]